MKKTRKSNWPEYIKQRYENYLKTMFYFKEPQLRESFEKALREEGSLLKGPFPESNSEFKKGILARELAKELFGEKGNELLPALVDSHLYLHQERAIRSSFIDGKNIVVATGTASGKTESFLYPILFELYQQYLDGKLQQPGVRAMILYPMNALANDQRERLGDICEKLREAGSEFKPTFGQYIGQTPIDANDRSRNASIRVEDRRPNELVFRKEMLESPPHILLTNYSMLEYLLIRPYETKLFDSGRGKYWQFIVLDEAHQYRGANGMEMGMLMRRLKQRIVAGGRSKPFKCIATSATISSSQDSDDRSAVTKFAEELFHETFFPKSVIFEETNESGDNDLPRRYHSFLRALEGAFLVHKNGRDVVVLNRKKKTNEDIAVEPLEVALCRECGQHYYVGQLKEGRLREAERDPSHPHFGVDYYLPDENGQEWLCRSCGKLTEAELDCDCNASIKVKKCESHEKNPDQLKKCEVCNYRRGGIGDPVQEIIHGSDGPNSVIATAMHELQNGDGKILAFADSRQEAAFFAWYAEDSYIKLRDRNLLFKAIMSETPAKEGLSILDLRTRLQKEWEKAGLFQKSDSPESKSRQVLQSILREAISIEKRLSLSGVGLLNWFILLPSEIKPPEVLLKQPWNFSKDEALSIVCYILDDLRSRRALQLPETAETPIWDDISPLYKQQEVTLAPKSRRHHVIQWGHKQSSVVKYLSKILFPKGTPENTQLLEKLMSDIWNSLKKNQSDSILLRVGRHGTFRLNPSWLRVKYPNQNEIWECNTCATISYYNFRGVCPRYLCPGELIPINKKQLEENHYRKLYTNKLLPPKLLAEEHTAQIEADTARQRQDAFKEGKLHLLSSSTTFEVGVDLGDLETVFLRNVPPETFNYTQRSGRAGRRQDKTGLVLTYCRRNPHDLYHYEDPVKRIISGVIKPPRLQMTNKKIIERHMIAVVLSEFFRKNESRFQSVLSFVNNWNKPQASLDVRNFCKDNYYIKDAMMNIVPEDIHLGIGLNNDSWIERITGENSRLFMSEVEVCNDYIHIDQLIKNYTKEEKYSKLSRLGNRMKTIANEQTLNFLSRKAIIPKYGFPVDIVELDIGATFRKEKGVELQRDLSQAIAEYAPGGKVVANKLEWESIGIKKVTERELPVYYYKYDDARNFRRWNEGDVTAPQNCDKYLIPEFGFVSPLLKQPSEPSGRAKRLYTTRPFFRGFESDPESVFRMGVQITKAVPGEMVILCEGRKRERFYICRSCGTHLTSTKAEHKTPYGADCQGTLVRYSLGHNLVTDVVRLQFPMLRNLEDAYSVAYALLFGASDILEVPDTDLNVTITGGKNNQVAIVLYDNVPGGAGLVAQLENATIFTEVIKASIERVMGRCGCDLSCYGCLRSYRNQFVHAQLDRQKALVHLSSHWSASEL